jgi:hypothetical protein
MDNNVFISKHYYSILSKLSLQLLFFNVNVYTFRFALTIEFTKHIKIIMPTFMQLRASVASWH